MIFLGLDISTNTGWSVLSANSKDNITLQSFGTIQLNSQMNIVQRITLLSTELNKVLNIYKPDNIAIEDLICGISGVKTLSYLGRLNGAVILTCSSFVKGENIYFYNPSYWKKNSLDLLNGQSKKWETQLAVVKYFQMKFNISDNEYNSLLSIKNEYENKLSNVESLINNLKISIMESNKKLNSKRNPIIEQEKEKLELDNSKNKAMINETKKTYKIVEKEQDKQMNKVCLEITSKTGINPDIADSICLGICCIKEVLK